MLIWFLCETAIMILTKMKFLYESSIGEEPTKELTQVIGRIHFHAAVGFVAACFFKVKDSKISKQLYSDSASTVEPHLA